MKKKLLLASLFVLVAVAVFIGTRYFDERRNKEENMDTNGIVEQHEEITSETIMAGIRDIGELATEEYYYTGVETYDSSKSINGFDLPFTQSRFIYSYDGIVKAGIDFGQITVEKDDLKRLVTITLPASRILSAEIDEESFQLYDEKSSIFNQISVSNMNDTLIELEKTAKENAIEKGLLDRADQNAEQLIKNFLSGVMDIDNYTIRFETATSQ